MGSDAVSRIEAALVTLVRRGNDPRGNKQINVEAGVEIERASAFMLFLVAELEPARLSELADAAGLDTSTASRQVARLVSDGYVVRSADPADGRATAHRLSPSGREIRDKLSDARRGWFDEALSDFEPAERQQLATLLERFVEHMPIDDRSPSRAL